MAQDGPERGLARVFPVFGIHGTKAQDGRPYGLQDLTRGRGPRLRDKREDRPERGQAAPDSSSPVLPHRLLG